MSVWLLEVMHLIIFGFLESIGVSLTLHQKDKPHFYFWVFYEGLKMPKILKKNQQNRLKWVKKFNLRKTARKYPIIRENAPSTRYRRKLPIPKAKGYGDKDRNLYTPMPNDSNDSLM